MRARRLIFKLALAGAFSACGSRSPYWDIPVSSTTSYGLANGVALVDNPAHRVVMLTALGDQRLASRSFPIDHNVASTLTSPDGLRLFVLATGDWPPRTNNDQKPSLTVIDGSTPNPAPPTHYTMATPFPNLAIDPLGHWAVAYVGAGASPAFVQNASELVVFDLTNPKAPPMPRTIRSRGSTPQRLTFTPELQLPKGQRRLLVVETDIDVTLLELGNDSPEVTIPLTSGKNPQQVTPAGVVVDGFDPNNPADARIALRAENNTNVFTFTLGPSDTNDFAPAINVLDVGGVPTDIAFVHTDAGLRVAALVPSTSSAVLVDPDTSVTTRVPLPASYSKLSLVTNVVGSTTGTDVAMLWNASSGAASGVAFWSLGNTVGKPYFSVEALPVERPIQTVIDVTQNANLKVLETADTSGFFVLDLHLRTASPLRTSSKATLSISPDGQRLWAFAQGGTDLASIDFTNLSPTPLVTDSAIDAVYDVARVGGGRSLIAIHRQGTKGPYEATGAPTVGATVFDALNPDTATSRRVPALLLEGP